MLAYHNSEAEKSAILAQLRAHAKADEIVKGKYWEDGKGCAVGCTIHSGNHAEYETRFGIPEMLAQLEDTIFEGLRGLPNGRAKKWPVQFMSAIAPGTDLSRVGWQFLHWLLTDERVNPGIAHPSVRDAVKQCADVLVPLTKGEPVAAIAEIAASAASTESAAWSAESAAWSAESAAWSAASAASTESAAWSAAWSAGSAAWSAESAAWSAASAASTESAAWSAESAEIAASTASAAAYVLMADKLLALLEAA